MVELSERELEVAELVALGLSYREIGVRLEISDRTVEVYVSRAATKIREAGEEWSASPSKTVRDYVHRMSGIFPS